MKLEIGPYPDNGNDGREAKFEFIRDDFFSLDTTLAIIIARLVREFKARKGGYPGALNSEEEWDKILDQIADGFQSMADGEHFEVLGDIESKAVAKKQHKGLKLFYKWFYHLWT